VRENRTERQRSRGLTPDEAFEKKKTCAPKKEMREISRRVSRKSHGEEEKVLSHVEGIHKEHGGKRVKKVLVKSLGNIPTPRCNREGVPPKQPTGGGFSVRITYRVGWAN